MSGGGLPLPDRILYMIVYAFVFFIFGSVLSIAAILQLVLVLLGRGPNPAITRFGAGLARYSAQVVAFMTFASDQPPFPFSDWPDSVS